jgi:hypothetical protein
MKDANEMVKYLSENEFKVDSLGRIIIEDAAILAAINGAYGMGDTMSSMGNGACANGSCH